MNDRDRFVERARRNIGVKMGDKYHKQIVDGYNRVKPLPLGYKVNYYDDWCDIFVTWCADKESVADLTGRECGVQRHLNIFKSEGIWIGRKRPTKGDIVVYDWQGFNAGWSDHIGIVERVNGSNIIVIEGNTGHDRRVKRREIAWNNSVITGYARPKWKGIKTAKTSPDYDIMARDTWYGKYGNGDERKRQLGIHYNEAMKRVNNIGR